MNRNVPLNQVEAASSGWDWRQELRQLDTALADIERQCSWDWRRDLADLETRIEQLAYKHGLVLPAPAHAG